MPASSPASSALARRPLRAALALLLLAAGCRDAVAPSDPLAAPESLNVGALQVRASSQLLGAPVPDGPAVLRTVVALANQGAWPIVLRMPACPVRVGGHRLATHADAPGFVYPGAPPFTNAGACVASVVEVTIAPGATHDLVAMVDLAALRAAVPPGRWYLLADVWLDVERSATIAVAAGEVAL
jgi:hypothetical protein